MPFLFVHYARSDLERNAYTLYKKKGGRPESLPPQSQVLFKPDSLLHTVYHCEQKPSTFAGSTFLAVAL